MTKFIKATVMVSFFISLLFSTSLAQEQITITTYYPSPFGSYRELRVQRMAIGNNYINGAVVCWDHPCPFGSVDPGAAVLVVEGQVGIGTASPAVEPRLHISGTSTVGVLIETTDPDPTLAARLALRNRNRTWHLDGDGGFPDAFVIREGFQGDQWAFGNTRDHFVILPGSGNVGIGTINPGAKLEVNGDGEFSGDMDVNGDITANSGITLGGVRRTSWPRCTLVWGTTKEYTSAQGIGKLSCPAGWVVVGAGHWNSSSDNEWPWIKCQALSISCN